jgi:hypothetical protein
MQIKDLSKELDTEALGAIQGGEGDRGNSAVNGIVQLANVNAGNVVFGGPGSSVNSNNNVTANQSATIFNEQNNGDFLALFAARFPTVLER